MNGPRCGGQLAPGSAFCSACGNPVAAGPEAPFKRSPVITVVAVLQIIGAAPASGYFASAEPTDPGRSGTRHLATDASGIVFHSDRPIANPIRPSATVVAMQ